MKTTQGIRTTAIQPDQHFSLQKSANPYGIQSRDWLGQLGSFIVPFQPGYLPSINAGFSDSHQFLLFDGLFEGLAFSGRPPFRTLVKFL